MQHRPNFDRPKKNPSKKRLEGFFKWEKETPRVEREQRLGTALGCLVEAMGYSERLSEQKAVEIWPEVVGSLIADVSHAESISHGTLKVSVQSPSWKQELAYMSEQIRVKLNQALGRELVSKIRFS